MLYGVYEIETELPLANHFTIETEFSRLSQGQRFWFPDYNTKGHRMGVVMKKYFDKSKVYGGYYEFAYFNYVSLEFTDFQEEGKLPDKRNFTRRRKVFGFGIGYNKVGLDGFYYGCALGLGRHTPQNDKKYTSTKPDETISKAEDEGLFQTPIDVYGRISVGVRLFNDSGKAAKTKYEREVKAELQRELEILLQLNSEPSNPQKLELEIRKLRRLLNKLNG